MGFGLIDPKFRATVTETEQVEGTRGQPHKLATHNDNPSSREPFEFRFRNAACTHFDEESYLAKSPTMRQRRHQVFYAKISKRAH